MPIANKLLTSFIAQLLSRNLKNIFVYVQHLLGTGHLHRTALLTRALTERGFSVTVVSGGVVDPTVDFGVANLIQLPAIKSDSTFSDLFDQSGKRVTDHFKRVRIDQLLQAVAQARPDLVLIETYPFGRRKMRFELLPLLRAIKPPTSGQQSARPIVACSVRDIIQPKSKHKRTQETLDLLAQYFDIVFVHGDKKFIRFEQTFPVAKHLSEKLVYTGYVSKSAIDTINPQRKTKSILVSAGGGAIGQQLYQAAISASKSARGQDYDWHILIGYNVPEADFRQLQESQSEHVKIERNRSDFIDLLRHCSVSISQGGYNTMMDIVMTRTPAIIVPFERAEEQEQLIRARIFEKNNLATMLREQNLTESALLTTLIQRQNTPNPKPSKMTLNGANWMADFIGRQEVGSH